MRAFALVRAAFVVEHFRFEGGDEIFLHPVVELSTWSLANSSRSRWFTALSSRSCSTDVANGKVVRPTAQNWVD